MTYELVPYGQGREVGRPEIRWIPPEPEEEEIPYWKQRGFKSQEEAEEDWIRRMEEEVSIEGEAWEVPPSYGRPEGFTLEEEEELERREARRRARERKEREASLKAELREKELRSKGEAEMERLRWRELKRKAGETVGGRLETAGKVRKEVGAYAGGLTKALTPTGMTPARKRDLYFGRARGDLYTPSAPKTRRPPIAQTGHDYGELRKLGSFGPTNIPSPMPNLSGFVKEDPFSQNVTLDKIGNSLRSYPKSWTRPMKFVYQEIKENHDTDTTENIRKDMGTYGLSSKEVDAALNKLRSLGYVQLRAAPWGGAPEWVVTDRIP